MTEIIKKNNPNSSKYYKKIQIFKSFVNTGIHGHAKGGRGRWGPQGTGFCVSKATGIPDQVVGGEGQGEVLLTGGGL